MRDLTQLKFWYESLSLHNLDQISSFYSDPCFFKDPFHQLHTRDELINLYRKMFEKFPDAKFIVTSQINDLNESVLIWDFHFNGNNKIHGTSVLKFNAKGKITSHIDYWDTTEEIWIKIPIIGQMIKLFYKIMF